MDPDGIPHAKLLIKFEVCSLTPNNFRYIWDRLPQI